jgi:hypothetical protein
MLFASQPIKELVSRTKLDGTPGPFQSIADASKLIDAGKKKEAIAILYGVLKTPDLETRIHLWTWSCLRELGEAPDPKSAYEVLGVILEVRTGSGYDSLAGYVDGSARYLNYSGAAIFWDAPDVKIKGLCQALADSTIPSSNQVKPRTSLSLPKAGDQVTLLTRSGNFVITSPQGQISSAGLALMLELMERTKAKKN